MPMSNTKQSAIVYFSVTGNTEAFAKALADQTKYPIFPLLAKNPYQAKDYDYQNPRCRCCIEHEQALDVEYITDIDVCKYHRIYLGFPIWWYTIPNIVKTFLKTMDFSHCEIILFATSEESGFCNSKQDVMNYCHHVEEGLIIHPHTSKPRVYEWIKKQKMI